jgi:hypothetical protein
VEAKVTPAAASPFSLKDAADEKYARKKRRRPREAGIHSEYAVPALHAQHGSPAIARKTFLN